MVQEPVDVCVSVCVIAYNQENYIKHTIESIINQKTSFSFELIIGEDCSKDGTRRICEEYQVQFPELIRLLPSPENYGMMGNFVRTLNSATGRYIAFCEGDDYWSDENKLQKQVDFLENNSTYTMVGHSYKLLLKNGVTKKVERRPAIQDTFTIDDYIKSHFIHINTLMYRNIIPVPDWFNLLSVGDQPLIIYMSQYGKIAYIDDAMSVYRVNNESFMSTNKLSKIIENFIADLKILNEKTQYKYDKSFSIRIKIEELMLCFIGQEYFIKQRMLAKNASFVIKYRKYIFKDGFSLYKILLPQKIKSYYRSIFKRQS